MNYNLYDIQREAEKEKNGSLVRKLLGLIGGEHWNLFFAFLAILVNSAATLLGPLVVAYAIDKYVETGDLHGVLVYSGYLLGIYLIALAANYLQTRLMGAIGLRTLYSLRNAVFTKIESFPVDFFNQNKSGDLISRINNDTDKLNQFFSQSLMRFLSDIIMMTGAGIFLIAINPELGGAALVPALFILIFTKLISPWVKKKNAANLKSTGGLSGEVQEGLTNFKTIVAFNRRDFFRNRFEEANEENYKNAVGAGLANNLLMPVYTFFTNIAQLVVLSLGIYMIIQGSFTIGFLISFLSYTNRFYSPLKQLAALWASFQTALAAWDRIVLILNLKTHRKIIKERQKLETQTLLSFREVYFNYYNSHNVLEEVNFDLLKGKTYAFIGPTGGGKSTSAALISRLYDPVKGTVFLEGKDIRSFSDKERSEKIGFILQEPFLFTGTLKENILYGNEKYEGLTDEAVNKKLVEVHLDVLMNSFDGGLETKVGSSGGGLSLGQKQLIAFIRAVLREPEILILDEATANIDTVTEQLLESVLQKLPGEATKVIIAHRLNTIENADEIFFVNAGRITPAGSMEHAITLLMEENRVS